MIVNTEVFKVLQGHVITCSYVLTRHNFLKTFPSQIFIFNNICWDSWRKLGWSGRSRLRRRSLRRGSLNNSGRVYIKHLDGRLGWRRSRLNYLGWSMFSLFPSTTRKISQVKVLGQRLPFVPSGRTSLGLDLGMTPLVHSFLPLVFFHSCHPYKNGLSEN